MYFRIEIDPSEANNKNMKIFKNLFYSFFLFFLFRFLHNFDLGME